MTSVKFLNGSHNVQGNIVAFYTKTSRVIVDFGMVGGFKEDQVSKLIKSHLLPDLPDLFLNRKSQFQHQAIILTQVNVDNLMAAVYLNSSIEIYVSKKGYRLYLSLLQNGLIQPIDANVIEMPHELLVGDLFIRGFASDCGVMGSQSLLISDGAHCFGVSGDVRINGPHRDKAFHWIRKFRKKNLDLFLFDSTAYSFSKDCDLFNIDESALIHQFSDLLTQRRDLIVINVDPSNVDRLKSICKKSHHYGRKVVLEQAYAKVLHESFPKVDICVLKETLGNKKTTPNGLEVVSLDDIVRHPRNYVLQNSFDNIGFLKKLKPGIYLHSNGFPVISLNRDFEYLRDKLYQSKFQYLEFGASGHASIQDVNFLVEAVNAKQTVPWHSYLPELAVKSMQDLNMKFIVPDSNKKLIFK
ncbi:hypothetical protein [Companilactobacillus furfuricola]|uniref:hypothetical protein n=1 Tax=Companilactobacillus furfuricola TaxID=1462575 RepID=UPI000F7A8304|nr:hypothetical protein [Companilactobacillus furfuricola]